MPWTSGVRCQRFFRSRVASGWFEIGRGFESPDTQPAATVEEIVERARRIYSSQGERFETEAEDAIRVAYDKTEPNGWVSHVGWAAHLEGFKRDKLRETMAPVREDEPVLQRMCASLDRVMDQARATATLTKVRSPALHEIQRKNIDVKPRFPFVNRMEDDSWARYKGVWMKLLCILARNEMSGDGVRSYRLTKRQDEALDALLDAIVLPPDATGPAVTDADVDRLSLALVMALLDHQLKRGHYDNAIISGLAVMGLRDDGGWVDVLEYTPIYSAVIKVARMMVLYQSYLEQIRAAMRRGFVFVCVGLSEIHFHTAKRHARGHCLAFSSTQNESECPRHDRPCASTQAGSRSASAILYPRVDVRAVPRNPPVRVVLCIPCYRAPKLAVEVTLLHASSDTNRSIHGARATSLPIWVGLVT